MAKPSYQLNAADYVHARAYLSERMRRRDLDVSTRSQTILQKMPVGTGDERLAEQLAEWCDKNLTGDDWEKLKAAIRKRRERSNRDGEVRSIAISAKAHSLLVEIAERDCVTFTDILEDVLSKAANSSRRIKPRKR